MHTSRQHLLPAPSEEGGSSEGNLAIECLAMLRTKPPLARRAARRVQGAPAPGGAPGGFGGVLSPRVTLALLRKLQRARE
jgi:hypothetical protein